MPARPRPRSLAAAVAACCLVGSTAIVPGVPAAGAPSIRLGVLGTLKTVLPSPERTTAVPIRVPRIVYFSTRTRVYAEATATTGSYDIELGFAPHCGGADACFAASFQGRRGAKVFGLDGVGLADGIRGRFRRSPTGRRGARPPGGELFGACITRYTVSVWRM